MYEVTVKTGFSAAHRLRLFNGKFENLHGHNWTAEVMVEAGELDAMGVGIDSGAKLGCLIIMFLHL